MHPDDPFINALHEWTEVFMRRSMRNFFQYSRESGLSMPQIGALFQIHKGTSGVSGIGSDLGVTSAAASQMLERLVQLKLIVRTEDVHDRRVKNIILTEKGYQILQESIRARQGWLSELAGTFTAGEKKQVTDALNILIEKATHLVENSA